MHLHVHQFIQQYGYGGVFMILLIEMIGIPFPAETTLTISGIEWTAGGFVLWRLLLAATMGNVVGSSIAYAIGRFLGRPVILRLGRFVGITAPRLDQAEAKFQRYRIPVILFAKFIAGIRILVPYLAGINRMNFWLFSLYNLISALAWSTAFIVVGRYIGVAWGKYHGFIRQYSRVTIAVVVVLILAYVFWKIYSKKRKKQQEKEKETENASDKTEP